MCYRHLFNASSFVALVEVYALLSGAILVYSTNVCI